VPGAKFDGRPRPASCRARHGSAIVGSNSARRSGRRIGFCGGFIPRKPARRVDLDGKKSQSKHAKFSNDSE
jgi:hypothetical protein